MRRKIKWINVIKLLIAMLCVGLIIHDTVIVTFTFAGWTWYGFVTFILAFVILGEIYDDFDKQIKSMSNDTSVRHTRINCEN